MKFEHDPGIALRERFAATPPLPDDVLREVLDRLPETPQQRTTSTDPTRRRFLTMFSASKFIVVGAIAALVGSGVFLVGMQPNPSPDEPVLTVTASPSSSHLPSPMPSATPTAESTTAPEAAVRTDILPGVQLTVEEVEPGLFRVLSDGSHDLADASAVSPGLDGSVWVTKGSGYFRLGRKKTERWPKGWGPHRIQALANGTLWAGGRTYSNGIWKPVRVAGHKPQHCGGGRSQWCIESVAFGGDGTVWVTVLEDDAAAPEVRHLAWLKNGKWKLTPTRGELVGATDDGVAWVMVDGPEDSGLSWLEGYDGRGWQAAEGISELFELAGTPGWRTARVGPDGAIWVYFWNDRIGRSTGEPGSWTVYATPGVPVGPFCYLGGDCQQMAAAPDGSLWAALEGKYDCQGLGHLVSPSYSKLIDDSAWTRYLEGYCVSDLAVARDGTIWLQAAKVERADETTFPAKGTMETYVITPQVAAATD